MKPSIASRVIGMVTFAINHARGKRNTLEITIPQETIDSDATYKALVETADKEYFRGWKDCEKHYQITKAEGSETNGPSETPKDK